MSNTTRTAAVTYKLFAIREDRVVEMMPVHVGATGKAAGHAKVREIAARALANGADDVEAMLVVAGRMVARLSLTTGRRYCRSIC